MNLGCKQTSFPFFQHLKQLGFQCQEMNIFFFVEACTAGKFLVETLMGKDQLTPRNQDCSIFEQKNVNVCSLQHFRSLSCRLHGRCLQNFC